MGLGVGRIRVPNEDRLGKAVVAGHIALVEIPAAAGHFADADQVAVIKAYVQSLEPEGIRKSKAGDQAAVGGKRVARGHEHAIRAHTVVLRVVGERIGNELSGLVPRQALPLIAAAVFDMGLFQTPRLPLHGIQNTVEIVHAVRVAETAHANALVGGVRKVLVGSYVDHFALANRGDHRAIPLAIAATDADNLMLIVSCCFLIGCGKSRHGGTAHRSGSCYGSRGFEKAAA